MGMTALRRRFTAALVCAAVWGTVAEGQDQDPFGGLPTTYRIRVRTLTNARLEAPGPDRRYRQRSRDIERLTFATNGAFGIGSRRRPQSSFGGTWMPGLTDRLNLFPTPEALARMERQLRRIATREVGVRPRNTTVTAPPGSVVLSADRMTLTGSQEIEGSVSWGRIRLELDLAVTWKGRRID